MQAQRATHIVLVIDTSAHARNHVLRQTDRFISPLLRQLVTIASHGHTRIQVDVVLFNDTVPPVTRLLNNDASDVSLFLQKLSFRKGRGRSGPVLEAVRAACEVFERNEVDVGKQTEVVSRRCVLVTASEMWSGPARMGGEMTMDQLVARMHQLDARMTMLCEREMPKLSSLFEKINVKHLASVVSCDPQPTEAFDDDGVYKFCGIMPAGSNPQKQPPRVNTPPSVNIATIKHTLSPDPMSIQSKRVRVGSPGLMLQPPPQPSSIPNTGIKNGPQPQQFRPPAPKGPRVVWTGQLSVTVDQAEVATNVVAYAGERRGSDSELRPEKWPSKLHIQAFKLTKQEATVLAQRTTCGLVQFRAVSDGDQVSYGTILSLLHKHSLSGVCRVGDAFHGVIVFPATQGLMGLVYMQEGFPAISLPKA